MLTAMGALLDYFISFSASVFSIFASDSGDKSGLLSLGVAPTVITIAVLFLFLFSVEIIGMIFGQIKSRNKRNRRQNDALAVKDLLPGKTGNP
jgi:hypothetical protein